MHALIVQPNYPNLCSSPKMIPFYTTRTYDIVNDQLRLAASGRHFSRRCCLRFRT